MSETTRWTRRAALISGLGLAGASLASMIQLSQQQQNSDSAVANPEGTGVPEKNVSSTRKPIRLGWSPWADAEVISLMAQRLIEEHLNWPVERVLADIGSAVNVVVLDLLIAARYGNLTMSARVPFPRAPWADVRFEFDWTFVWNSI